MTAMAMTTDSRTGPMFAKVVLRATKWPAHASSFFFFFCAAFNELYMDLNRPGALLRTINPSAFNAVLVGQGRELSDRQEDAFELFDLLASKLSDESLAFACPPSLTDALVPKQPTPSSSMIGGHATTPLLVRMKITSSLEGLLGTTIRCRDCGFSAPVRVVPFDSLPLAVPINACCTPFFFFFFIVCV